MVIGKGELVGQVAERAGLSSAEAGRAVAALLECIAESLCSGDQVRLTGFGTFRVADTSERAGHDPRTGGPIVIPAGKRVLFSASARLRSTLVGPRGEPLSDLPTSVRGGPLPVDHR